MLHDLEAMMMRVTTAKRAIYTVPEPGPVAADLPPSARDAVIAELAALSLPLMWSLRQEAMRLYVSLFKGSAVTATSWRKPDNLDLEGSKLRQDAATVSPTSGQLSTLVVESVGRSQLRCNEHLEQRSRTFDGARRRPWLRTTG
jgi:hypothetical protein